jgi:hypothetical protein
MDDSLSESRRKVTAFHRITCCSNRLCTAQWNWERMTATIHWRHAGKIHPIARAGQAILLETKSREAIVFEE